MSKKILELEDIIEDAEDFVLVDKEKTAFETIYYLDSKKESEICPECGNVCHKVKTRYRRKIKHGVNNQKEIILNVEIKQFKCDNPDCSKKSFAQSVPFAEKWQQRTKETNKMIIAQTIQTGFRGTQVVLENTGFYISYSSIRRLFSRVELEEIDNITFIGIDDVAIRKGHSYMTVFYDGITHEPANIIDGRYGDAIINYLEQHPEIRWAARDRDSFYAKALSICLIDCIQVADRFHLIYNANEKVTEYLGSELDRVYYFKDNELISRAEYNELASKIKKMKKLDKAEVRKSSLDPQNQESVDPVTLQKRKERIDAYLDYHAALKPHPENIVLDSRFFLPPDRIIKSKNKKRLNYSEPKPKTIKSTKSDTDYTTINQKLLSIKLKKFTRTEIIHFVCTKDSKKPVELKEVFPALIKKNPCLVKAQEFYDRYYQIIMGDDPQALDSFISDYKECPIAPFRTLARGLMTDIEAVKNSIRFKQISSGFVEGSNNKLKLIKRKGYGNFGVENLNKMFRLNYKLNHGRLEYKLSPTAKKEYYALKTKKKSQNLNSFLKAA